MEQLLTPRGSDLVQNHDSAQVQVARTDILFFKAYESYMASNSFYTGFAALKVVASASIYVICQFMLGYASTPQDTWCLLLAPVSALQYSYHRLISGTLRQLQHYLALAQTLQHVEYVRKADLHRGSNPDSIEGSVNVRVFNFNDPEESEGNDRMLNFMAAQIGRRAGYVTSRIAYWNRLSFWCYILLHSWGCYIVFYLPTQPNPILDQYIVAVLIIGTYQFLDFFIILVLVALAIPIILIVQAVRFCTQRFNSYRFIQLLKPKQFVPAEVRGDHECKICMNLYLESDQIITLPCNRLHHFHSLCIRSWLGVSLSCPICRAPFSNLVNPD